MWRGKGQIVNLGIELERDISPAKYLWDSRVEFPGFAEGAAVEAAIEAGVALEAWQMARARRCWRVVIESAEQAGRMARREGLSTRRLVADIDRVLDAVEVVVFDGRLPPDMAARTARMAAKMSARAVEHMLRSYWEEGSQDAA
jgi:hypothetical protein